MTKIKFDVTDVEPGQDFDTPVPVGLYMASVAECEEKVSGNGNEMLALTLEITDGDWKGRNLWDYIVLNEASAWKMRQFLEAVGLVNGNKAKGTLDTRAIVGTSIQVRVKHETDDEYGTRAKVGALLPTPADVSAEDVDDEPAEQKDSDDGDELTYKELQAYGRIDMEALIEENDLEDDIPYSKRTTDEKLRERIAETLELTPEEDEEEGDDEEAADYPEMTLAELKAELKERGLSSAGTKKTLIKRLEKADKDDGADPF